MYNIENELVNQKNAILALVNAEDYERALSALALLEPLWITCEYGYKARELRQRIRDEARMRALQSDHWSTRQKWERLYGAVSA